MRSCLAILLLVLGVLLAPPAPACDYFTMRDAAYDVPRDVHRLCVIGQGHDQAARQIHDRLAAWVQSSAGVLNIELVYLAADDPAIKWAEYGIPSAPASLPVVALVGRNTFEQKSFVIDHWEPGPGVEDLERLKTSPAREAIQREVGRRLGVLVYVPGTGSDAGRAQKVIDAVVKTWADKPEWPGLSVVKVDRGDKRERLLLAFAGVKEAGPDWVTVVFGRGKFMPPLEGEAITEARLNELIEVLIGECGCLRPPHSLGVDVPMVWNKALDDAVVMLRTDDDPDAVGATRPAVPVADQGLSVGQTSIAASTLWTLVALAGVVGLAAVALLWHKHRRVA